MHLAVSITHRLQFAKVFFAKLPAVLIRQSFLPPKFFTANVLYRTVSQLQCILKFLFI